MKKIAVVLIALFAVPASALAWPWSQDMMNQPSIKPQEGAPKAFPKRSVPTTGFATKFQSRDDEGIEDLVNPVSASPDSIAKGKDLYTIYCSACHGVNGDSQTFLGQEMGAIPLADPDYLSATSDGWMWGTITFGGAVMPAYGVPSEASEGRGSNDLSVTERWHVVNYLKHQLVKDAAAAPQSAAHN